MQPLIALYRVPLGEGAGLTAARADGASLEVAPEGLYLRATGGGLSEFASTEENAAALLLKFMTKAGSATLSLVFEAGTEVSRVEVYPAGHWPALGVRVRREG